MHKITFSILLLLIVLSVSAQEQGKASYYAEKLHGNKTASGEIYDHNDFTAAHRHLPFGAVVQVTNLKNNKAVRVKINDNGPHSAGRIIDLSGAAAEAVDMIRDGIVAVRVDIISEYPDASAQASVGPVANPQEPVSVTDNMNKEPKVVENSHTKLSLGNITAAPKQAVAVSENNGSRPRYMRVSEEPKAAKAKPKAVGAGLFKLQTYRVQAQGYGVQVGSYTDYANVLEIADQFASEGVEDILIHSRIVEGQLVYRMILGPFSSRGGAEGYAAKLKAMNMTGFVLSLSGLK